MNLNQVTIPVTDLDTSIAFYQVLGLQLIVYAPPHYARFTCPDGHTTFSLHLAPPPLNNSGVWIYFETEQLDIIVQQLLGKGIVFESMPEDQPWLWREARLKDPNGNQLILFYAGNNRKDPPWKLQS